MTTGYHSVPINGALLRATRLLLGLGTRELARAAGTTFNVVDRAEKENTLSASATIADARRLAHTAGLNLADLLTESTSTTGICGDDAQRLAGVLISDKRLIPRDDLAAVLHWTLDHLDRTTEQLDAALAPIGLRVHSTNGGICIRPRHLESLQAAQSLERRRASRETMNLTEARLLRHAVLHGGVDDKPTAYERPALGRLINLGCLRPGRTGEPFHVITDEAKAGFRTRDTHPDAVMPPDPTAPPHPPGLKCQASQPRE